MKQGPTAFDGYQLIQMGKTPEAAKSLKETLRRNPRDAEALYLLGSVYVSGGVFEKGASHLRKAIRLGRVSPDAYNNLGCACLELKKDDEARRAFELALELDPTAADPNFNLARLLAKTDSDAAAERYRIVLEHNPDYFEALINLADLHLSHDQDLDSARLYIDRALAVGPDRFEAHRTLGQFFFKQGMMSTALGSIKRAATLAPNDPTTRWVSSLIHLQLGHLEEGWKDYDTRFDIHRERIYHADVRMPRWEGQPLDRKTILVWSDQGIGDDIVYGTFLPGVMADAKHVIFQCYRRTKPIFERTYPDLEVVAREDVIQSKKRIRADYHIGLPELGKFYRREFADFSNGACELKADPQLTEKLRARYARLADGKKIIGLSWKSNRNLINGAKISTLEDWVDLLKTPGCFFVSLQYGVDADEIAAFNEEHGTSILFDPEVDPLQDMDASFAQCGAMDLVISTSNSTVHTAASINIPTWLILPEGRTQLWYWFMVRSDSPIYPSLRIFRQGPHGVDFYPSWPNVMSNVTSALENLVQV